ncbi:hypothetical protein CLAIMM_01227 [Cladophialophora immunda]|nr:hypothetical protein CLAIMM_01227 [Cladophialophora immunda]
MKQPLYVLLGAGVVGLSTALELRERHPKSLVIVVAKHLPGDRVAEYASPWAGANWLSVAIDNGRQEEWDAVTYKRFRLLAGQSATTGVQSMELRAIFDQPADRADILSVGTGQIWYDRLVGGLRPLSSDKLPEGSQFGFDLDTFVIDTRVYLFWLEHKARKMGIEFHRAMYSDIAELFHSFPGAKAYFNCSALGSHSLKGVEDKNGQVMLVENPTTPLTRMYFRSPRRVDNDTTYVFPRGMHNGVVLGGCRLDNDWSGEIDADLAEDIKRRCCNLAPELGSPEDLKILYHAVGLRPSRKGGARIEREVMQNVVVIHNYGAGGAGYQASWGMAKAAVDLLGGEERL